MRFIDGWGNEYHSKEEVEAGLLKILRNDKEYYYNVLSEKLNIPINVLRWIADVRYHYTDFFETFKIEIELAEHDWIEGYLLEVEEVEE